MIRDLAQAIFFGAWFVLLFRYRPLRDLIRATPRYLTIPVGLFILAWLVVQLTDQRGRYFPVASVYMYGDHTPTASTSGVAVRGRWCDGDQGRIDLSFVGRSRLRSRMHLLYTGLSSQRTAADSAARWDLIDRTLASLGRMYNRTAPKRPLCSIGLDEARINAEQYESGIIPAPRVVRDVALR